MSNYVADKVGANRAGIKNLFQKPDGSSICGEASQCEGALEMSPHTTARTGKLQRDSPSLCSLQSSAGSVNINIVI